MMTRLSDWAAGIFAIFLVASLFMSQCLFTSIRGEDSEALGVTDNYAQLSRSDENWTVVRGDPADIVYEGIWTYVVKNEFKGYSEPTGVYYVDRVVLNFDLTGYGPGFHVKEVMLQIPVARPWGSGLGVELVSYTGGWPVSVDNFTKFGAVAFTPAFDGVGDYFTQKEVRLNASGVAWVQACIGDYCPMGLRGVPDMLGIAPHFEDHATSTYTAVDVTGNYAGDVKLLIKGNP